MVVDSTLVSESVSVNVIRGFHLGILDYFILIAALGALSFIVIKLWKRKHTNVMEIKKQPEYLPSE